MLVWLCFISPFISYSAHHRQENRKVRILKQCVNLELLPSGISTPILLNEDPCFVSRPMSFEGCKLLLRRQTRCNALRYDKGLCSLININYTSSQTNPIERDRSETKSEAIVYWKDSDGDCSLDSISAENSLRPFKQCLRSADHPSLSLRSELPLLAVVISVTSNWAEARKDGFASVVSNFQCYCNIHKYSLVSNANIHVLSALLSSSFLDIKYYPPSDCE